MYRKIFSPILAIVIGVSFPTILSLGKTPSTSVDGGKVTPAMEPTVTISLYREHSGGETPYYWVNEAKKEQLAYLQFNGSEPDSYIDCIEWWVDQRTGTGFQLYGTASGGNRKRLEIDGNAIPGNVHVFDIKIKVRYELPPGPLPFVVWSPVIAVGAIGDDNWPVNPGLNLGDYFYVCSE